MPPYPKASSEGRKGARTRRERHFIPNPSKETAKVPFPHAFAVCHLSTYEHQARQGKEHQCQPSQILKAVERLGPEDFLKLRTARDRVEERLWNRELGRAMAKHRKAKLTDAKIDEMLLKRRYRDRRP